NIEVIFDVDASVPAVLHGDAAKLKKILWHLLDNAVKFTKEGGVLVRVSCEKQSYGVNVSIEVTDTGIGMDTSEERKSFNRFYQADSVRTRFSGGLGLGLPIVIGFLQVMGGFLYVDSTPGSGSTLRVSIPQTVVDESECFSLDRREEICVGAFFVFETIANPQVRDFYGRMIKNFAGNIRVSVHRAQNIDNLKRLVENISFTHILTGAWEYTRYADYLEELALRMVVCVVADKDFKLREGSGVCFVKKPVSAFPLINVLNHGQPADEERGELYLPGIRVLVVDDEPMNITVAVGIFDKYGMEVTTAESGPEAVELCALNDFDIVFMDHMMPGMDGVEAMKRIRAEAKRRGVEYQFVALTANALSSAREMFFAEGFEGFVSKPIELSELERVLKKLLPKASVQYRKKEDALPAPLDEKEKGTDLLGGLAAIGIDTEKGMHYSRNDADFYAALLGQFAGEAVKKEENAKKFLAAGDLAEYAVIVHSIKGTAKMIGAEALSEEAKRLEHAAKAGEEMTVREGDEGLFRAYRTMAGKIASLLGEDVQEKAEAVESKDAPKGGKMFEFLPKGGHKS
ncbi:MAG: response regulator, partial [Lachnospiraceae bacterium]|nr:response regulator [Lachnospiraceae bacterium]